MKIKGLKIPTESCGDNTWLQFWEKTSRKSVDRCAILECTNTATLGVHVQKVPSAGFSWYVMPVCEECSKNTQLLIDVKQVTLVPANAEKIRA